MQKTSNYFDQTMLCADLCFLFLYSARIPLIWLSATAVFGIVMTATGFCHQVLCFCKRTFVCNLIYNLVMKSNGTFCFHILT